MERFLKGYVSVIIPCYNGAKYCGRLLESICSQTYQNIHVIFVNDGSEDETEQVFSSFENKFKKRGLLFDYLFQKNQGQAAAFNKAFAFLKGEYCIWLDADDFITTDHIEKKVAYFEKHKDCAIVVSQGVIVNENDLESPCGYLHHDISYGSLFEDILLGLRPCSNGLYMVRTEELLSLTKEIYVSRIGQNLQLLLPICYCFKACYMKSNLFYYVERKGSHSHNIHGMKEWRVRLEGILDVKTHILAEMDGLFDAEYKEFLQGQLHLSDFVQRLDVILGNEWEDDEEEFIIKEMQELVNFLGCNVGDRKEYWLWGACGRNKKLAEYLGKYTDIVIEGFIDSDRQKQSEADKVIGPENIRRKEMYIIIPLQNHADIVAWLRRREFQKREDFFYPRYEIVDNLLCRKEKNASK